MDNIKLLAKLVSERTRWQRKHTIAANKLDEVHRQIEKIACELAAEQSKRTVSTSTAAKAYGRKIST